MNNLDKIRQFLSEILDLDIEDITQESYIIRELGAESIDLLELAVELNALFKIEVDDDVIFLRKLRQDIQAAEDLRQDSIRILSDTYPYLSQERIEAIYTDLDNGPVLKVRDIACYVTWRLNGSVHA